MALGLNAVSRFNNKHNWVSPESASTVRQKFPLGPTSPKATLITGEIGGGLASCSHLQVTHGDAKSTCQSLPPAPPPGKFSTPGGEAAQVSGSHLEQSLSFGWTGDMLCHCLYGPCTLYTVTDHTCGRLQTYHCHCNMQLVKCLIPSTLM